jgi:hypothetical protein
MTTHSLTPAGEDFRSIIELLSVWGQRWGQGLLKPEWPDKGGIYNAPLIGTPQPADAQAAQIFTVRDRRVAATSEQIS